MTHEQWQAIERSIVLHLLDNDHPEPWTVGELEAACPDVETLAVRHALAELEGAGVVVLGGLQYAQASRATRRLDDLGLIAV
jgi:hypothetical protein